MTLHGFISFTRIFMNPVDKIVQLIQPEIRHLAPPEDIGSVLGGGGSSQRQPLVERGDGLVIADACYLVNPSSLQ